MSPLLPPDYKPSDGEEFMNPMQLEYFRQKLLHWRAELLDESNETLSSLQNENLSEPDLADRATRETDRAIELRTRDRERKLISKIDEALRRIDEGNSTLVPVFVRERASSGGRSTGHRRNLSGAGRCLMECVRPLAMWG